MASFPNNNFNPRGRPVGAVNRRNQEIFRRLEERGDKDPADILSQFASDETRSAEFRSTCANYLLPYKYGKRGTIPAPRFIDDPLVVPDFTSVEEAQDFLKEISIRAGKGELELQAATDISNLVKNWIVSKQTTFELDLKAANAPNAQHNTTISIKGGLPELPGTQILMPQINGRTIDGQVLEHQPTDQSSAQTDPPTAPKDQSP